MQDETAIRTLLFYGADPTKSDHYGVSPLHIAAAVGSQGCVHQLIDGGAMIEQQDCFGVPAAHYAAMTGSIRVLEIFMENEDPNIQDYFKEPLLYHANHAFQLETVKYLIEHGASTTLQDQWGYNAISDAAFSDAHDILLYFADQGFISRNCLFDGKTILHIAALNSDIRTIMILSRFSFPEVDPHARDNAGHTALDYIRQRTDSDQLLGPFCALLLKAEADNMRAKLSFHHQASALDSEEEIYFDALEDLCSSRDKYL
jgi:ankyrin repeat protein